MLSYVCVALVFVAVCNGQTLQAQTASLSSMPGPSAICPKRNGFFKQDGSCDSYIECRDFRAIKLQCPEGLNYNPASKWPAYPCGYPMDVPCLNRGISQPARPTAECPHQYGFFPSLKATADNCGSYRLCVEGKALEMACPLGLAFDPDTSRCDWPDQVKSCNSDNFLGFRCPAPPLGPDGQPLDLVLNYKYEGECFYFFSCDKGRARLLSCDYGFAFDPVTAQCVDAELVNCHMQPQPQLLAASAA